MDILVSKFPEKMFSTYGNTMKQEFHGIYLKENRFAPPPPTLSNQLSQQSLGLTDRRETKVSPSAFPSPLSSLCSIQLSSSHIPSSVAMMVRIWAGSTIPHLMVNWLQSRGSVYFLSPYRFTTVLLMLELWFKHK